MNCLIAFGIGLVIGLLPLIYGIFRAMKMVGGDFSNFSWKDVKSNNKVADINTDYNKNKETNNNKEEFEKLEE